MADIDTAAIRAYWVCEDKPGFSCPRCGQGVCDCWDSASAVSGLCDEVDRLRARLAAATAERDEHRAERHRLMKLISVREVAWEAAEAKLAAVEKICAISGNDGPTVTAIRAAVSGEGDRA